MELGRPGIRAPVTQSSMRLLNLRRDRTAAPQRAFTAAFAPFIRHLNDTANHLVRRFGLEPAEELASARTLQELVALARHSAAHGVLPPDSAELFVRTLHLGEFTAENVMTPHVDVHALHASATAADVANLTLVPPATRASPSTAPAWTTSPASSTSRTSSPWRRTNAPELRSPSWQTNPCWYPTACRWTGCWTSCATPGRWPWSSTNTAARPASSPWRTSSRKSSERSATNTTPPNSPTSPTSHPGVWGTDGSVRRDQLAAIGLPVPDGPYETIAGLVATRLERIPAAGDGIGIHRWELTVLSTDHHRADRLTITAPRPTTHPDAVEAR
jgi:hypothetical protein